MARPDFLPVTVRLISRHLESRSLKSSLRAGMRTPAGHLVLAGGSLYLPSINDDVQMNQFCCSAAYQFLQCLRVTSSMYGDPGGCSFQLPKILACEFDGSGSEVLLQPMQLRRARNWNNPWLLSQQPGKCNLSRRCFLLLSERANQINQRPICFAVLFGEARNDVAEVGLVKPCIRVDCASEKTLAQRAEGNKTNAEFLERRYHFCFWLPKPQRIFALKRRNGLHSVRAADSLYSRFRKSKVL